MADEVRDTVLKNLNCFVGMTMSKMLIAAAEEQVEQTIDHFRKCHRDFAYLWPETPKFGVTTSQTNKGTSLGLVSLNESAYEILHGPVDKPAGG